jgi:hypothetical protein
MSFKKVEFEKEENKNTPKSIFTYEVNMIVSVFAEDQSQARQKLDEDGGFVSRRDVELKDVIAVYDKDKEE